jgi:hypothetical protein
MTADPAEISALRPSHQVSAEDYPGEWARQVELTLDEEGRRAFFYGGLFCAFVVAVVVAAAIGVIVDAPPEL